TSKGRKEPPRFPKSWATPSSRPPRNAPVNASSSRPTDRGPIILCTLAATTTLDRTRTEQGIPEDYGVRLFAAQSPDGEIGVGVDFRPDPLDGDEVTEQFGTRIMVAPDVAGQ